jgi:uncharacterized membrane protein
MFVYLLIGYSVAVTMGCIHVNRERRYLRRTLLLISGMRGYPMEENDQAELEYLMQKFNIKTPEDILKITKEQLSKP